MSVKLNLRLIPPPPSQLVKTNQNKFENSFPLFQLIESRLKLTLPDDLPGALRDGVVLCHLANNVRPRSVSSIHVPSPAVVSRTVIQITSIALIG